MTFPASLVNTSRPKWSALVRLLLALVLVALTGLPVLVSAQTREPINDVDQVERTVLELSRLAARGNGDELYDWLSEMSRDQMSRAAFTTWLNAPSRFVPTADPVIRSISFGEWTWGVTGVSYPNVATVTVHQPGQRMGRVVTATVTYRLLNDGVRWRWLFGDDAADVNVVFNQVIPTLSYASTFDEPQYADIDAFWARIFLDRGMPYEPVRDIVAIHDLPYSTACGEVTDIDSAGVYLCLLDQTIYYSPTLKASIDSRHGSIGWHTIIAHEWSHQVQTQLGIGNTLDPELGGGSYISELEAQADCMTGIYVQDQLASREFTRQEVQGARSILSAYGDLEATHWENAAAHGTSAQRVASFNTGFRNGFVGCGLDLDTWLPAG
jgi:predicted metalloprotease